MDKFSGFLNRAMVGGFEATGGEIGRLGDWMIGRLDDWVIE
jgi:hypothetical protein